MLAAFCATGCSAASGKKSSVTRVYVNSSCPNYDKAESLGAIALGLFLEPLITAGIKGIGGAIKKAGEDKVTTVRGMETTHFYSLALGDGAQDETELNLRMGCLTVVHGQLSQSNDPKVQDQEVAAFLKRYPTDIQKADVFNYLSPPDTSGDTQVFSDDIRFFVQYQVKLSDDLTAMRFIPIAALSGQRIGKDKKSKTDLVVVSSIQTPSNGGADSAIAIATSNFASIQVNKYFKQSELKDMATGWMPLPAIPESVKSRVKANAKRRQDLQAFNDTVASLDTQIVDESDSKKKKDFIAKRAAAKKSIVRLKKLIELDKKAISNTAPITVKVSLTETQKGNEFLVKLGSYISDNSATIAKPIAEAIDPAKREAAKATEEDAEDTLRIAAIEAVAGHEAEVAKSGSDRSESKIRVAKIKASQACRKLRAAGQDDVMCIGY